MKPLLLCLALHVLGSTAAFAGADEPPIDVGVRVKVERLTMPLPEETRAAESFLWESFSKSGDDPAASGMLVRDWEMHASVCSTTLVAQARELGLEADALLSILTALQAGRGSLAIVPIAAYQTTQGDTPVWIVVAKWESASAASMPNIRLGHIRMAAHEIGTGRQVAFKTCL